MPFAGHRASLPADAPETLTAWTRHWARVTPGRAAIISAKGQTLLTYGELAARCESLARGLVRCGVKAGNVVAMQLPNSADFVALYIAIGMCRAIVQTIHMSYRRADIAPLLRHSGATLAIVEPQNKDYRAADELLQTRERIPRLRPLSRPAQGVYLAR
jgi:acyl-CoA synthetase (AMP-forming)/AMP-acid ligase II